MDYQITHNTETNRFETTVDGYTGYVEYYPCSGAMDIIHTVVPTKIEGRGVAAALVKATYEYAKEKNLKIIPSCSYALVWSKRHPEYANITA